MSHLVDVNLLLACAWSGHADHARANRWLNSVPAAGNDVTDAHLVRLASSHGLRLATLDGKLCRKAWANGIAENPG